MTQVDCTAKECIYNEEKLCCRAGITVEGNEALEKDETYCGNYEKEHGSCCRNASLEPSSHINIRCDVLTCKYNDDRACAAESIDILHSNTGENGQTKCDRFEVR